MPRPTKTQAIKLFLTAMTHPELADLYNAGMECQVNPASDGGTRLDGEYRGRHWVGWTDDITIWKPFRVPWKADTKPEFKDSPLSWDLSEHAEGIGMTGWDWQNLCSRWVAFDFDAIVGHSESHQKKLTIVALKTVQQQSQDIPWVTIRKSTSGKGLHLYVHLDPPVPTDTHTEHAALARSILGMMSAITGFDFHNKVDNCGGNMWVWHRKMKGTDGLVILKSGEPLDKPPLNWRDHITVTSKKGRKRKVPPMIAEQKTTDDLIFEELCGQQTRIPLEDDHKRLLKWLEEEECLWWWDQDRHMLVTHTADLKIAHGALGLTGIFETVSTGSERKADQNCFAFPLRQGAWAIRRHTPGVQEHATWTQDGQGWTRCYFNKSPDLQTASRSFGGVEEESGEFIFREAEQAVHAASALGVQLDIPARFSQREAALAAHKKDGRLIFKIKHESTDNPEGMEEWRPKKNQWTRIFNASTSTVDETDIANFDEFVRHLTAPTGDDYGWLVNSDARWRTEPLTHVRAALAALGHSTKDVNTIIGTGVMRCWTMVNRPFQPEYPGNREWNRNAAQLRYPPTQEKDNLSYPHWSLILNHCGRGLDDTIQTHGWCKANGISSGGDYLKCWVASLFQEPLEPLPYLFLFGPQNSGKSVLHEALDLLMTRGYQRADNALMSQSGFNGELENALVCVVEETDLHHNKQAYSKIKDWVTARQLNIRHLYRTPYHVPNSTHWIQCANDHKACPIFPGDTRITMVFVDALDPTMLIPKKKLIQLLEKEAPDFLAALLSVELPPSNDRLNLPVIETSEKLATEALNESPVNQFINEICFRVPGESVPFSDFYARFLQWIDPAEVSDWTKIKLGRALPPEHPRGAAAWDTNQRHIGNLSFENVKQTKPRILLRDNCLRHASDEL